MPYPPKKQTVLPVNRTEIYFRGTTHVGSHRCPLAVLCIGSPRSVLFLPIETDGSGVIRRMLFRPAYTLPDSLWNLVLRPSPSLHI